MMFWRNIQYLGQQYISSVIYTVDGIPTTPPAFIQTLCLFCTNLFASEVISVHSLLHYLVTLLFSKNKIDSCILNKTNGFPHIMFSYSVGWNCLGTLSGSIPGGACNRCPSTHCARHMPSVLYWRQWEDDLGYSRAARRPCPSRFLVLGQHTPGKTIGEEQEKGSKEDDRILGR
jgi:hypothetical protein